MTTGSENQIGRAPSGQPAGNAAGQIVCPNCGATFSADEARCPYCDALNPVGAEKAYMEELAEIREDTDDLDDDARADFKRSLQSSTKRTVTVIVIVVAVIALLFLAVTCVNKNEEQQALRDYQARESFRTQYFEEFDRLYEAGDDDALSSYVWSLSDDPGFDALFSWKHIAYLEIHDGWEGLRAAARGIEEGTAKIDDYTWSVSLAMRLAQLDTQDSYLATPLSREEETRVAKYRDYAREFLRNTLQMSDAEVAALADDCKDEFGYIQKDALKRKLEARFKEIGTTY